MVFIADEDERGPSRALTGLLRKAIRLIARRIRHRSRTGSNDGRTRIRNRSLYRAGRYLIDARWGSPAAISDHQTPRDVRPKAGQAAQRITDLIICGLFLGFRIRAGLAPPPRRTIPAAGSSRHVLEADADEPSDGSGPHQQETQWSRLSGSPNDVASRRRFSICRSTVPAQRDHCCSRHLSPP